MRRVISMLCVVFVCAVSPSSAQDVQQPERLRAVVVPRESGLVVVASQPGCPLQFENARHIAFINSGGGDEAFHLRNRGTKPIRAYTIAGLYSNIGGGWEMEMADQWVMPGQTAPQGEGEIEIVPLTDALRERLRLGGPMRAVIVLMVVRVEFADGTTYNDESTYNALKSYFERIATDLQPRR